MFIRFRNSLTVATLLGCCLVCPPDATATERGLLGHWKLMDDCQDSSGRGNHGVNHGVEFSAQQGARFDGIEDFIEVPAADAPDLSKNDCTIAVWIHTADKLDDVLGDVLSQYDPATRTGWTLSMMNHAAVTSAQSNHRNVLFGIDAGRIDPQWTDCGRPGNSIKVSALTVYDGNLYAGTFETGSDEAGHVYRYEGGMKWTDCGSPDTCNAIPSLAVYEGKLYAGSRKYDPAGSSLPESPNENPGGKIFRYEGGTQWTNCGKLEDLPGVLSLSVFRGELYAAGFYQRPGQKPSIHKGLYRYDDPSHWTFCGNPGRRISALMPYNGHLYAGSYDEGVLARWEGSTDWADLGNVPDTTQIYAFAVHRGKLCTATWPTGSVFRYNGQDNFTHLGRLGSDKEVMAMVVYNGKLYAGTLPSAHVFRYDDDSTWTSTGQLDTTPDVKRRRVWSMAVYDGKLFAGTLPSGRVLSLEAGKCVTYDRTLAPGWRHLAAVRSGRKLKLYVDGKLAATSSDFDPASYDLSNGKPLLIGFGEHDYFNGRLRNLRIYERALSNTEIGSLSTSP